MTNYKEILNNKKEEVLQKLKSIETSAKPVNLNEPIGRLSRMDAMQHQQMALNAKKQLELNLIQLEEALERLKSGDYGICLLCEEEINPKRLLARPEASLCVKCQK